MDSTIQALQALFLRALPTLFLVVLLHFYLKFLFFRPLERLLKERFDATEGARRAGHDALANAEQRSAEYEAALRHARSEVYLEQERMRRQLEEDRAVAVAEARRRAGEHIGAAKAMLHEEVEVLKGQLAQEADALSEKILVAVLPRRAA